MDSNQQTTALLRTIDFVIETTSKKRCPACHELSYWLCDCCGNCPGECECFQEVA